MGERAMDWQGRHVIVTGGSSGIGKATAICLAAQGANISILARDPQKLAQAEAEIANSGRAQVFSYAADLSDQVAAEQAISAAVQALGAPDLLVTSAGIAHPGYFRELPIQIFEQTMAINYFGTLYCIKAALPHMEAAGGGHIALICSGAGLIGIYGYTPYSPSKFAVRGLAEALRGELKVWNIGLSIVYPADTDTPQLEAENRTKPAETKQITATAEMWSAERMAAAIVKGIEQKAFVIAPGQEMSILAKFHSLIAPGLNWYFDRIVRQVRAAASKA